jgi:type I restriction enzyme S subunit
LNGRVSLEEVDYIPEAEYRRISQRLVIECGDVLLSCSGSVGRSCVCPPDLTFALVRSVAVLKPGLPIGQFLSYALQSSLLQRQIHEKKTQTAQANIFQGKIKSLLFPLPPLPEQGRIVDEIQRRFTLAERLQADVSRTATKVARMRSAILKAAFAGRLTGLPSGLPVGARIS